MVFFLSEIFSREHLGYKCKSTRQKKRFVFVLNIQYYILGEFFKAGLFTDFMATPVSEQWGHVTHDGWTEHRQTVPQ